MEGAITEYVFCNQFAIVINQSGPRALRAHAVWSDLSRSHVRFNRNMGCDDLVIFHKIYYKYNDYCVELPSYLRPYVEEDRRRLRSNVNPPDYLNSQVSTTDLSNMRTVRQDEKSLKCEIESNCPQFKCSFFFRAHLVWNHLPVDLRSEECPLKFKKLLLIHLWADLMKPD